jgi:hypothetical protein
MAKFITKNQLIGDIGEQLVGYILSSKLNVIYRPISKRDTGIDGEIELTKEFDNFKYEATGTFIKVQVKASTEKEFVNGELSIQLSSVDKNYFISELNLPGVLLFADLKNKVHKVYWAEVIPTKIQDDSIVTIKKKNIVSMKTIGYFKKMESYYRSIIMRSELMELLNQSYNSLKSWIIIMSNDDSLSLLINDFNMEFQAVDKIYLLGLVKNAKKKNVPEYENIFESYHEFKKEINSRKDEIDRLLDQKGFHNYDFYLDDEE